MIDSAYKGLENTVVPLSFAGGPSIKTLIKEGLTMQEEMSATGLVIKLYRLIDNPTAMIAIDYKEREKIKLRTALVVAQK